MPETRYLSATDVEALTAEFFARLGYAAPILRAGGRALLESAVQRARNCAYYEGGDVIDQAAALCNGIALNHPWLDGNKRSAFIACLVFLHLNDCPLAPTAYAPLGEQIIAQHERTDRSEADALLSAWLRKKLERN
jgi:death on curing protein